MAVSEGWTTPESNADAVTVLGDHAVITPELATQLGRAAGFRNVLVHRYVEVDDEQVLANLARLTDLDDYDSGRDLAEDGRMIPGPQTSPSSARAAPRKR